MNLALPTTERARAELAALFPVRNAIAHRAGTLRTEIVSAAQPRRERLEARAMRYERLVRLLETRIRLAAEVLASGSSSPLQLAAAPDRDAS
jgi:putative hemolysin